MVFAQERAKGFGVKALQAAMNIGLAAGREPNPLRRKAAPCTCPAASEHWRSLHWKMILQDQSLTFLIHEGCCGKASGFRRITLPLAMPDPNGRRQRDYRRSQALRLLVDEDRLHQ